MAIHYPLRLGPRGSSNGRVLRAVRSGRVPYTLQVKHLYECRIRFGAGDFTPAAATSQVIDLNSIRFFPPFPQQVRATDPVIRRLPGTYAFVKTGIAGTGITDADIEVGDSVDPNGLLTVSPAYDGDEGLVAATPAAAENAAREETDFAPTLRVALTGGGLMTAINQGEIYVYIPFEPIPVGD
ncbi:MAG: hypothetical protein KC501_41020 [Myxococcales bacterium]|nr:hypothetical protein [Myxococcales bacterium]